MASSVVIATKPKVLLLANGMSNCDQTTAPALPTLPNNVAIVWYLYRHCRWRHHRASPRRHTPVAPRSPTPPVTAATA